ncbi:MAG: hypothetical protein GY796_12365 [Chloroflexi bacterium]|nr:hypothetical protein [Chloroflexota bacterium]
MQRIPKFAVMMVLTIFLFVIMLAVFSTTNAAPSAASSAILPATDEIDKYIAVTFGDDADIGDSFIGSNAELGADRIVLSVTANGGCPGGYPNLVSVFGSRWDTSTTPDSIVGAATLFEGVDFSSDVALTSDNGGFKFDNSVLFARTGAMGVMANPLKSASNSEFEDTGGVTTDCSATVPLTLGNGVSGGHSFTQLLTDLQAWKTFLSGLATEYDIDANNVADYSNNPATNGTGGFRTNYDAFDTNNDGVVVIDVDPDSDPTKGDPFKVENIDWVIEGAGDKLIVFRLLEGSDMQVNNASILMGANYAASSSANFINEIGIIFLSYQEGSGSSDSVFNAGSNVILNGVAWWDLNVVGEGGPTSINTNLIYNNSQGCGQLISQKVNLQGARWSRCSSMVTPEPAVIGDYVWLDENGDGIQDAGESGIPNVTIELQDGICTPGSNCPTTTTDTNGRYLFTNVISNTYTVVVNTSTLPAGLAANPTYDEDGGGDSSSSATVTHGQEYSTADFGYNWVSPTDSGTPPMGATGAIGDRVWIDADGNGVQDPGEAGLAGVTVSLLTDDNGDGVYGGAGDNSATTTTTNEAGNYIFDGLSPGSYVVEVTSPVGYTQTGDPDTTLDNKTTDPVVLGPGDVYLNADFGYQPSGNSSAIGDTIFLDTNGDGNEDAGELGISGVTVALLDNSGNVIATTITDASGTYSFPGLPSGTYTVWVNDTTNILGELNQSSTPDNSINGGQPCGACNQQNTLTVDGASDNANQDFGYVPDSHSSGDGIIGDTIFLDSDGSATLDTGEGLEGVTVRLYDSTGTHFLAATTTNKNGNYYFGGLSDKLTYVVKVDTSTLPNGGVGMTNSIDPDGGNDSESSTNLSLATNGIDLDQDFGYTVTTPNTINGTVWEDSDANGTLDEAGTGISGVTVVLYDNNGNVVASTVTDSNGDYSFPGLPDGTYSVDVTDDNQVLDGFWHSDGPNDGLNNNSQDDPYTVTVSSGSTNDTADFGYYKDSAGLGNLVWDDTNNDGLQAGESGIFGVEVVLTITYPNGDVVSMTTTTDSSGLYSFGSLLLDENYNGSGTSPTYIISIVAQTALTNYYGGVFYATTPNIGDGSNDSDDPHGVTALPIQGTVDDTFDFGFTLTPTAVNLQGIKVSLNPALPTVALMFFAFLVVSIGTAVSLHHRKE